MSLATSLIFPLISFSTELRIDEEEEDALIDE